MAAMAIGALTLAVLRVFRKVFGLLALTLAVLGLGIVAVNPIPWIAHLLPLKFYTVWGVIHVSESSLQGLLTTLYADQIIYASTIGAASFLILVAWVAWFRHPLQAVLNLGRGIKASPMAVLRSPVNAYRKIIKFRNWFLAKVEYLQGESAKWKTTFNVLKSPYSLLRSMGLSPQMAATFLFAGSAVGGGVIANELSLIHI